MKEIDELISEEKGTEGLQGGEEAVESLKELEAASQGKIRSQDLGLVEPGVVVPDWFGQQR